MKKAIQVINDRGESIDKTGPKFRPQNKVDEKELEIDEKYKVKDIEYNSFANPKGLSEYDINIIDLSNRETWSNRKDFYQNINSYKDLKHIANMIKNADKFNIVVVLPQDISLRYDYREYGQKPWRHHGSKRLKDIPTIQRDILSQLLPEYDYLLYFENTTTSINKQKIKSDFYFSTSNSDKIKTFSDYGKKATTVNYLSEEDKKLLITTLDLDKEEKLLDYLFHVDMLDEVKLTRPEWVNEIEILNDSLLKEELTSTKKKLNKLEKEKGRLFEEIEINNEYKEILYEKGDQLEIKVREILEEILGENISNFKDKKKEDFLVRLENITFIGEIKGVNSNIKNSYISQLVNHVDLYVEKIEEQDKPKEEIKPILIINYQRERSVKDRDPINKDQIEKAKRDDVLIIKTEVLLKLLENIKEKNIDREDIIKILSKKNGVLKNKDIKKIQKPL